MTATDYDNLPAVRDNTAPLTMAYGFEYGDADDNTTWYLVENNKLYNHKHEVAIVYSPGFGGDWSTYSGYDPTDARVAVLTLTGGSAKLTMVNRYGDEDEIWFTNRTFKKYHDNNRSDDLAIEWLPAGTLYQIDEYDGFESVRTNKETDWRIA